MGIQVHTIRRLSLDEGFNHYQLNERGNIIEVVRASTLRANVVLDLTVEQPDGTHQVYRGLTFGRLETTEVRLTGRIVQMVANAEAQPEGWIEFRLTEIDSGNINITSGSGNNVEVVGRIDDPVKTTSGDVVDCASVSVGTSPVQIRPYEATRTRLNVVNMGAETIYVGQSLGAATTGQGFPIPAGGTFTFDSSTALYAVTASGAQDVRWLTESV